MARPLPLSISHRIEAGTFSSRSADIRRTSLARQAGAAKTDVHGTCRLDMTLIGFLRGEKYVMYTNPEHLDGPSNGPPLPRAQ